MSELTDDQLDGLFRKSAEEFDPQFDPAAWQDMKSRLDNHDRTQPGGATNWKNVLRRGLPVLLLLLLTSGVWYVYQHTKTTKQLTTVSRKSTLPVAKEKTAENGEQPESSRLAATSSHASPTVHSSKPEGDEVESREEEVERSANRAGLVAERSELKNRPNKSLNDAVRTGTVPVERATNSASTPYKSVSKTSRLTHTKRIDESSIATVSTEKTVNRLRLAKLLTNSFARRKQRSNQQRSLTFSAPNHAITATPSLTNRQSKKQQPIDSQSVLVTNNEVSATEALADVSKPVVELNELAIRPARWSQPLAFVGRPVTAAIDTPSRKVVQTPIVPRGLSIRVAIAPDLSTIGLKNFSRPGTNIGLLLEYRLAARWSIQAGVIQSTKIYRALPEEYTVPMGAWGGPIPPLSVDGRCNMLDIPINVRYDILVKPQNDKRLLSRWFISAGVTNYIMKAEDYTYNYPPHTYNQNITESKSTGGYGLSNLNLSVGYERAFSRRLSWQIEPFMKVPLKGVGYFKIDLLSTGTFFSIRYKL